MTEVPSSMIEALRDPAYYGWSVGEVARAQNIELGTTDAEPRCLGEDPRRFSLRKRDQEIAWAVCTGLADIFSHDRRQMNDPHRWDSMQYLEETKNEQITKEIEEAE